MTAITTTGPAPRTFNTAQAAADTPAPAPDMAFPARPDAVVISLGKGTLSAAVHPFDTTAEQRVNSLVEEVRSHNAMADLLAHFDWASHARDVGETKAAALKAELDGVITGKADRIGREFGESGIDARPITDKQAAGSGVAPGSLLVDGFSFESGGSTYTVTPGEDGTLVGTRDGQAWKTWRITPARADGGAAVALSTLQALVFGHKSGTTPGSGHGMNLVA